MPREKWERLEAVCRVCATGTGGRSRSVQREGSRLVASAVTRSLSGNLPGVRRLKGARGDIQGCETGHDVVCERP